MSMDVAQLKEHIIKPACDLFATSIESATVLLLGTCAQESLMGTYLKQVKGVALGIFQIEPATYHDLMDNYFAYREDLFNRILRRCGYVAGTEPDKSALVHNLLFSACIARTIYFKAPEALPAPDDIEGLARYWKKYYNTVLGKGSEHEFIANYKRYVA